MIKPKGNKHHTGLLSPEHNVRGRTTGTGPGVQMKAKFKGYCNKCHYTIWKNEVINYNGVAWHVDCVTALKDPTPRALDKRYIDVLGKVKKNKLVDLLDKR